MNNEGQQKRVEKIEEAIAPKYPGVVVVRTEGELETVKKQYAALGLPVRIIHDNVPRTKSS